MTMAAPLPSLAIANYFIGKSLAEGRSITPMKLVKLVYIAHGWHLGNFGTPLITDAVEAWKYGPVIPVIYRQFKEYGGDRIGGQAVIVDRGRAVAPTVDDPHTKQFLDDVWEKYKRFSGGQLSAMTHRQDTPWYRTWVHSGGSEYRGAIIPSQLIEQHYRNLLDKRSANHAPRTNHQYA